MRTRYLMAFLCLKGNIVLKCPIPGFWNFRDFLAVLFTFLGELPLWFVNLQPRIKIMLMLAFLSVQAIPYYSITNVIFGQCV